LTRRKTPRKMACSHSGKARSGSMQPGVPFFPGRKIVGDRSSGVEFRAALKEKEWEAIKLSKYRRSSGSGRTDLRTESVKPASCNAAGS
jgi:hypothetical protein